MTASLSCKAMQFGLALYQLFSNAVKSRRDAYVWELLLGWLQAAGSAAETLRFWVWVHHM
jgi:hypothetical protein